MKKKHKIYVFGFQRSGKSNFINRVLGENFNDKHLPNGGSNTIKPYQPHDKSSFIITTDKSTYDIIFLDSGFSPRRHDSSLIVPIEELFNKNNSIDGAIFISDVNIINDNIRNEVVSYVKRLADKGIPVVICSNRFDSEIIDNTEEYCGYKHYNISVKLSSLDELMNPILYLLKEYELKH